MLIHFVHFQLLVTVESERYIIYSSMIFFRVQNIFIKIEVQKHVNISFIKFSIVEILKTNTKVDPRSRHLVVHLHSCTHTWDNWHTLVNYSVSLSICSSFFLYPLDMGFQPLRRCIRQRQNQSINSYDWICNHTWYRDLRREMKIWKASISAKYCMAKGQFFQREYSVTKTHRLTAAIAWHLNWMLFIRPDLSGWIVSSPFYSFIFFWEQALFKKYFNW